MEDDLELTGNRYEWLLTIFYISYILFEPQVIMWKIVPAHIWAALIVFAWGFLATIQSAVHSWQGEMALRFLLGASEAGFGPGVPFLLSFFYLRHEVGLRVGIFLSAAPLANSFAGALAYGITSGHSKLANWRLLFLVEGMYVSEPLLHRSLTPRWQTHYSLAERLSVHKTYLASRRES